jgi:FixJ family two-component response regulator
MGSTDGRLVSIVDDDASLRRSLRNLASVGFRVQTFPSAEAFLESGHRENTGCIVLDLWMSGMRAVTRPL